MKKSIVLACVLGLALVACKKKDAAATGDGSGSGSGSAVVVAAAGGGGAADCKVAIDHSMELSGPMMAASMPNYADVKDKMRDMGIRHCTDDKWPAEAVKCMTDAKAVADAQACYGKLTPEQSDKMNNDAKKLMTPPAAGSGSGSAK